MANSNICAFKTNPEKNRRKHPQSIQKSQQQQHNTNSFHVLIDNTGFSL